MYEHHPETSRRWGIDLERILDRDDSSDYDVYLWWPSQTPYIVQPDDMGVVFPSVLPLATPTEWHNSSEGLPQYEDLVDFQTISTVSTRVTESADNMSVQGAICLAGYNTLFTSGLMVKSEKITRSFEQVLKKVKRGLAVAKKALLG